MEKDPSRGDRIYTQEDEVEGKGGNSRYNPMTKGTEASKGTDKAELLG